MSSRPALIAAILLRHGTKPGGGICDCGHIYRMGDSIVGHRAQHIDVALDLAASGVPHDTIPDHTAVVIALNS